MNNRNLFASRLAAALALLMVTSASIAQTRPLSWPSGWRSPLGSTVPVTTNYAAFSRGCTNANTTSWWTYYLEAGRAQHLGLDMDADVNDPVKAMADGRVLAVGTQWGSAWKDVIVVEQFDSAGTRFSVAYGHINKGTNPRTGSTWQVDDVVKAGDVLGKVAGIVVNNVVTSHLHVGIMEGQSASIPGSVTHGGRERIDPCPSLLLDTRSPETFLRNRSASTLSGSIVGSRNSNGSITNYLVSTNNGVLRRNRIPSTSVATCLKSKGAIDRGLMGARFLGQMPDAGIDATCR